MKLLKHSAHQLHTSVAKQIIIQWVSKCEILDIQLFSSQPNMIGIE